MKVRMTIVRTIVTTIMMMMEVEVWHQIMLAYTAHDSFPHLLLLVPYPFEDADGDCGDHTRHQEEESGVDIGEPRAVEGRRRCAPRHRRQHPFLYLVQDAAFVYSQYTTDRIVQITNEMRM